MKSRPLLICMTPVRNEAWILHAFLNAASLWADYIIIADQGSIDGSREIAVGFPKVILLENLNQDFNESERQKLLINKAREIEGDKILFALDADEIFSANFKNTEDWQIILNSNEGDVFGFQWANITPERKHYFKSDFYFPWVVHDDGKTEHKNYVRSMHSMRIPFPDKADEGYAKVNDFKVLHLQHYFAKRNYAKQRFYLFVDYSLNQRSTVKLSRTYFERKIKEKLFPLSKGMLYSKEIHGFDLFDLIDIKSNYFWFDEYIVERILQKGTDAYKTIDIWSASFMSEYNFKDPRSRSTKLLHAYLRATQNISKTLFVRAIDKSLKKAGL